MYSVFQHWDPLLVCIANVLSREGTMQNYFK